VHLFAARTSQSSLLGQDDVVIVSIRWSSITSALLTRMQGGFETRPYHLTICAHLRKRVCGGEWKAMLLVGAAFKAALRHNPWQT